MALSVGVEEDNWRNPKEAKSMEDKTQKWDKIVVIVYALLKVDPSLQIKEAIDLPARAMVQEEGSVCIKIKGKKEVLSPAPFSRELVRSLKE